MNAKRKMSRGKVIFLIVWLSLIALIIAAIMIIGPAPAESESVKDVIRDSVLHEMQKVKFFGLEVNPGLVSAYLVTALLLICAAVLRIFIIPRFRTVPGKFQTAVETAVGFFSKMARDNSPHRSGFLGAFIFSVGSYVFFGTLFELVGVRMKTAGGSSVTLPAPLSDINGAIAVGVSSYTVLLLAGLIIGKAKGFLSVLKDFSLPISMSFRLFGALLSGLIVTELVYYYSALSYGFPVIVGVLFTLLHAVIQTYVLTTLVSIFYGEATEIRPKKIKVKKEEKAK